MHYDISEGYRNFTVLKIPEINKSHCAILRVFIAHCSSRSFPSVSLRSVYTLWSLMKTMNYLMKVQAQVD